MSFNYQEFTTRNIGFVNEKEQLLLKNATVFIPGVGGMGGIVAACLARSGVENFIIADMDEFEVSNLNRQIFANLNSVGKSKAETTKEELQLINPNIKITLYNETWVNHLEDILPQVDVVVNGCDDSLSTVKLMRKCKVHGIHAVDAFAATLPNVYVIRAEDPRPEEVFKYPTFGIPDESLTKEIASGCLIKEIEHVAVHSSSLNYIDLTVAQEIMEGKRSRVSFAPMVWTTGCMMSYEAIRTILKKPGGPSVKGLFFNVWTGKIEKPKNFLIAALRRLLVKKYL
ncbi:MAG: ThiF family adenylyltransferase [Flavobacteriales bacterium]|nr:ThiF family adenylyltransferase [Flavobacteriales bacterium]